MKVWLVMVVFGESVCVNSYSVWMEMYACYSLAFGSLSWIWLLALASIDWKWLPYNKIYIGDWVVIGIESDDE